MFGRDETRPGILPLAILITGGTKGIGLAIARRLARHNERLLLGYFADDASARAVEHDLAAAGASATAIKSDVGTVEGCRMLVRHAGGEGLHHVVHNAASIYPTTLLDADLPRFARAIETNGTSLLYLVASAVPLMRRGGSIVFITSAGARAFQPRYGALGCGKALAESIIRYLVPELAPLGIRINAVAPGLTDTTSVSAMVGSKEAADKIVERAAQRNPSGRGVRDSDYTSVVDFLLSPEAEYVQGQVIQVNGGSFV